MLDMELWWTRKMTDHIFTDLIILTDLLTKKSNDKELYFLFVIIYVV
jgi:hypothetical protein